MNLPISAGDKVVVRIKGNREVGEVKGFKKSRVKLYFANVGGQPTLFFKREAIIHKLFS